METLTFTQKLLAVQKKIPPMKKDGKAKIITKSGASFEYDYTKLEDIISVVKPLLNEQGLYVEQPIMIENGKNILQTFIKDTESKEATVSSMILPDLQDPQKLGAVITYFRRYSLQSLLFLEAEDTDAADTAPKTFPNAPQSSHPRVIVKTGLIPLCDICKQPMKHTKSGAKNPFYCKHGDKNNPTWGKAIYPTSAEEILGDEEVPLPEPF